jgi:hypothetical protein
MIVLGIGVGLSFAPSINTATVGVARDDAGVASAMVNTSQQIGGTVGTAALSTIFSSALTSYLTSHGPISPIVKAEAAVHGYTVAYSVASILWIPVCRCGFRLAIPTFLRDLYADMQSMEDVVRSSGLDWTRVRSSYLVDSAPRGDFRIADGHNPPGGWRIARADLASFLLDTATSDRWARATPTVAPGTHRLHGSPGRSGHREHRRRSVVSPRP